MAVTRLSIALHISPIGGSRRLYRNNYCTLEGYERSSLVCSQPSDSNCFSGRCDINVVIFDSSYAQAGPATAAVSTGPCTPYSQLLCLRYSIKHIDNHDHGWILLVFMVSPTQDHISAAFSSMTWDLRPMLATHDKGLRFRIQCVYDHQSRRKNH